MEKREPSYTVGGKVNRYNHYGEQKRCSLKKLKIELPYDLAIPLLGIHLEKTLNSKRYKSLPCSLQCYLQWPRQGSNLNVHQHING